MIINLLQLLSLDILILMKTYTIHSIYNLMKIITNIFKFIVSLNTLLFHLLDLLLQLLYLFLWGLVQWCYCWQLLLYLHNILINFILLLFYELGLSSCTLSKIFMYLFVLAKGLVCFEVHSKFFLFFVGVNLHLF